MPATAGPPGKMPPGNRLSTSDSLATHDVWKQSVGYDPYAGKGEDSSPTIPEVGEINNSAKGLFRLAQLTGNSSTLPPGACKRCGQVGHLYFHCRNTMTLNKRSDLEQPVPDDDEEEEENEMPSSDSSDDDDSDSSSDDSDDDSDDDDSDSDDSDSSSSSSPKKKKGKKRKKASKSKKKDKKVKKKDKKKSSKDKKKKRKK
mmetsp:Transcript_20750/g.30893  ORF Transcript_20750/g.30893 Transcript_20750/m.30893 type:complete len:201 (-) Transcript_20750:75-677(-)